MKKFKLTARLERAAMCRFKPIPIISALLLVLFFKNVSAQTAPANQPVEPPPMPTVLKGGLGVAFDATKEAVLAQSFKAQDPLVQPGVYYRFDHLRSFPSQFLRFTALTGKLYSIVGQKFYKTENGIADVESACLKDMVLTADSLKEKYPTLVLVDSYSPSPGKRREFCEAKAAYVVAGKTEEIGYQRCVIAMCQSGGGELSTLTVIYTDVKLSKQSTEESKSFSQQTIEQRRQKAGIKKDEL